MKCRKLIKFEICYLFLYLFCNLLKILTSRSKVYQRRASVVVVVVVIVVVVSMSVFIVRSNLPCWGTLGASICSLSLFGRFAGLFTCANVPNDDQSALKQQHSGADGWIGIVCLCGCGCECVLLTAALNLNLCVVQASA